MVVDASAEGSETTVHLGFALDCGYLEKEKHQEYLSRYEQVGKMLTSMSSNPEKFKPQLFCTHSLPIPTLLLLTDWLL